MLPLTYFSDKSEDVDLLCLPNTMRTIHGLKIHLRVPGYNKSNELKNKIELL
jgi:hypothetical protein